MQTEAIFENIAYRIQDEISKAQKSIYIAVAWFTNKNIFDKLIVKAKEGCAIHIIISNDEINNNSSINFDLLERYNGNIYKIGNGDTDLMHHKFCVIDENIVITGSYNWSYKAENDNLENIVINVDMPQLAEQFIKEFNHIKKREYPKYQKDLPIKKVINRLKLLKLFIKLEQTDSLMTEAKKLEKYDNNKDIKSILKSIQKEDFDKTLSKIKKFVTRNQKQLISGETNALDLLSKTNPDGNKRKQVSEILERRSELFIGLISEYYPLNDDLIEKHIDRWYWNYLSQNESLPWSIDLIEKFKDQWKWNYLSQNKSLPWSVEFIERFKDCWDWYYLSSNTRLPWSIRLIENFKDKWSWHGLSTNEDIPWSVELIERFKEYWHWTSLIQIRNIPLPNEIINKHLDEIQFLGGQIKVLKRIYNSKHIYLDDDASYSLCNEDFKLINHEPWSIQLIEEYEEYWQWYGLSENEDIPWSIELIKRFKNRWYWACLSTNTKLPWSAGLIEKFKNYWTWNRLAKNESIPWSIELIENNLENWSEEYVCEGDSWRVLSSNRKLPWSIELIERYKDYWHWGELSDNKALPWSLKFIDKYADNLIFSEPVWKTLKPFIDYEMIEEVFERMAK